ncbi:hypothetical protein [Paractinoplanes maris]|uniref:hypothetical protein n=1 Tax=Paractinoplanes maris TaxID=1734446 RepID=UPI0020202352|nr:hypothetical protein [Actinoplanes maris]
MDQYLNTAYDVTTALFGPESGIPWWAWMAVVVFLFWKVAVKEPKTATDRDNQMLGEMFGDDKGKKKKK